MTEVPIEETTSNISENTNFRSRLRIKRCPCIEICLNGPLRGQRGCGKNGKCTGEACDGDRPQPTSPPDDIS